MDESAPGSGIVRNNEYSRGNMAFSRLSSTGAIDGENESREPMKRAEIFALQVRIVGLEQYVLVLPPKHGRI
jgi:hypothetical protein